MSQNRVILTKYAGSCAICKIRVEQFKGFAFQKNGGRWQALCQSKNCAERAGVKDEVETLASRQNGSVTAGKLSADGFVTITPDADQSVWRNQTLPLLRSFPGADWKPEKKAWKISLDPQDRMRVLQLADKLKLEVAPVLRDVELPSFVLAAKARAKLAGAYPFQLKGVEWLSGRNKALLADDMGLGKTFQTIMSLDETMGTIAIVPASVKYNWQDEISRWRPQLKCTVFNGRSNFRWPEPGEVMVITYDVLVRPSKPKSPTRKDTDSDRTFARKMRLYNEKMATYKDRLAFFEDNLALLETPSKPKVPKKKPRESFEAFSARQTKYTDDLKKYEEAIAKQKAWIEVMKEKIGNKLVFVLDEAHGAKNYKAARTRRMTALSKICAKTWFLTGTPILNRPQDLWGILAAGDMHKEVFGSWNKYVRLFNGQKNHFGGYEWGTPDPSVPELFRRVGIRRIREDVLPDLPKKTFTTITVDCPVDLMAELDDLWNEYEESFDMDELPPFTMFSRVRAALAKARIPEAVEIVEQYEEQDVPLIVFSAHHEPLEVIGKRDGWALITGQTPPLERRNIMKRFQEGKLKGVAASILAAGVGLTLTHASHALFIDLDWSPKNNAQAEDRICRISQTAKKVQISRMVSNHRMDQHILKLLSNKSALIDAAIDAEIKEVPTRTGMKIELIEETEEEYAERMRVIDEAAAKTERERILGKVGTKLEIVREQHRGIKIPKFTEKLKSDLRNAWSHMLAMCDGAVNKDFVGFNKPDAAVAHWTMQVLDDDSALELAYLMLRKYRRQLSDSYPILFPKAS